MQVYKELLYIQSLSLRLPWPAVWFVFLVFLILMFLDRVYSFMTSSFMVESMAIANAVLREKEESEVKGHSHDVFQFIKRTFISISRNWRSKT